MAFGFRGHSSPLSFLATFSEPLLGTWCGAEFWGHRRVCCQEGTQASAESSQVGECHRQESWGGGQNRRLCSYTLAKGKCHPSPASCPKVVRSTEVTLRLSSQTFYGFMATKVWTLFIMAGKY